MNLPSVQSLLTKYGIQPKKSLGQNFLIARPTMEKIVDALGVSRDDTVFEIGCGMGVMAAMLSDRCQRIIALDADRRAITIAREEFGSIKNVEWVLSDILKADISSYAKRGKLCVIGNIPYNISSPILFHLVDHRARIKRAVLMIQKEVADRVTAKPNSKDYGALSVMLQSYARCTKLFNVARTNFMPRPKIMSSVIELDFRDAPDDIPGLRDVVQTAFQKRRKTIKNALGKFDDIEKTLADLGIDPKRRPETLSVEEFHDLAKKVRS